jgi:pSer/pThr/pTyr-binding forkhead associated (FHA) protein
MWTWKSPASRARKRVDAVDLLILALRLLFVALLYVFLIVVVRLSVAALRSPERADPRSAAQLELVVIDPGASALAAGEVIAVAEGATLGRSDGADVLVADSAVSGEHARIERIGRRWVVTDLGSTNGTRVNDARVARQRALRAGDVLSLGTVRLQVKPR